MIQWAGKRLLDHEHITQVWVHDTRGLTVKVDSIPENTLATVLAIHQTSYDAGQLLRYWIIESSWFEGDEVNVITHDSDYYEGSFMPFLLPKMSVENRISKSELAMGVLHEQ